MLGNLFPSKLQGLTTWAEPQKAVYLRDNISRETVRIGVFDGSIQKCENRMIPVLENFNTFGVSLLEKYAKASESWVTIDEIGYLENGSEPYQATLKKLFDAKSIAAVVRKQDLPFLNELLNRGDVFVVDMDDPFGNIGCVIMASGLGKRFGGNKLMADFGGKPMIERILDSTEGIFSCRVVVTRSEDVAELCRKREVSFVLHGLPNRNDTVRLGLDAMKGVDRCMFTPADQPLLSSETIAALALSSKNLKDSIWRTSFAGVHGSPVVFPRWSFDELLTLPEGKGGNVVVKKHPELLKTVEAFNANELKDVDTVEDLEELLGMLPI